MELFKLFGSIFIENDRANQSMDETEAKGNKLMGTFGKVAGVLAGAFAVDKILEFGKTMLNTTADLQALDGQYSQVMGGMKADTDKYLDQMSTKWNKHPTELKSAYMQYVAILKSKGMSEKESHETAKKYMDATVDANAFANEDMGSTVARFMGGIKGEYDSLDTAMVNLSATMLNDMSVKEYGKKFDELTVAQQEALKTQEMLRQHTSAGVVGQGAREADSYANNLAMIKNTWNELLAKFGSPLLTVANEKLKGIANFLKGVNVDAIIAGFSSFGGYMSTVLSPIIDGVKSNFSEFMGFLKDKGVIDGFQSALEGAKGGLQWFLNNLPLISQSVGDFIDKWDFLIAGITGGLVVWGLIQAAIGIYSIVMGVATGVTGAFGTVLAFVTSPIGIVVLAIGALIAIGVLLYKNWDVVKQKTTELWTTLTTKFSEIKESVSSKISEMSAAVTNKFNEIKTAATNKFNEVKDAIMTPINAAVNTVENAVGKIKGFFSGLKLSLPDIKTPHFKLKNWSINPLDWVKNKPSVDIDWYAKGTNYADGGLSVVGEQGPELINLPRGSKVHTAAETRKMKGTTFNFERMLEGATFVIREEADVKKVAKELFDYTRRAARGKGVVMG